MPVMSFIKNVSGLTHSPMKAMEDVKNGSWATPILALSASVGYMATMPSRSPEQLLMLLKWWGLMQVAAVLAIWLAGLPMGGRGTLAQIVKVVAFLTLVDGLALYFLRTLQVLPHIVQLIVDLLPVLFYLAIKAVHEYPEDSMCFRVTTTAFFIYELLLILAHMVISGNLII
jgi:hypothetical protein